MRHLAAKKRVSRVSARRDLRLVADVFTFASTSAGAECGLRHYCGCLCSGRQVYGRDDGVGLSCASDVRASSQSEKKGGTNARDTEQPHEREHARAEVYVYTVTRGVR